MGNPTLEERNNTADTVKKEADARKAAADATTAEIAVAQAKLKAITPTGDSKPQEGTITTDAKAGYISTLAAYKVLIHKAKEIADRINNNLNLQPAKIMIVDSLDFCSADIQLLQVTQQIELVNEQIKLQSDQIDKAKENLEAILVPPKTREAGGFEKMAGSFAGEEAAALIGQAPAFISGVISSIADIVGYFKVNYDIKGQDVTLSNVALQSLVADRLTTQKHSVYLPNFHRIQSSAIIQDFADCTNNKDRLVAKTEELKTLLKDPRVVEKKKDEAAKGIISAAEKVCENSDTLISEFIEFKKAMLTVPKEGIYSPLGMAAVRQYIDDLKITHLLYLTIPSGGGEMVTGTGLFRRSSLAFLGGCVVCYVLAEPNGKIVSADTNFGYMSTKYDLGQNQLFETVRSR